MVIDDDDDDDDDDDEQNQKLLLNPVHLVLKTQKPWLSRIFTHIWTICIGGVWRC